MNKEKLHKVVIALVGEAHADAWWSSSNKAFKGKTPSEMYQEDPDVVRDYLMWHAYGAMG